MNYCIHHHIRRLALLLHCGVVLAVAFQHKAVAESPAQAPVASGTAAKVSASDFVEIRSLIPNIVVDLPYATENNFFKKRFYASDRCYLRRGGILKLAEVQKDLNASGLGLKIWDGYRPRRVQWEFWKVMPDSRYVADPKEGSRHNRGAAVDATLVDLATGKELLMPTGFDDFTPKAAADFKLAPAEAIKNRSLLHAAMKKHGFTVLPSEWWHFDAEGWKNYPLEDIVFE